MSPEMEDHFMNVLARAYKRGARTKRELETVLRVDLACLGLEVIGAPHFWLVPSSDGTRIGLEAWIKPARGPAKVIPITQARRKRRA